MRKKKIWLLSVILVLSSLAVACGQTKTEEAASSGNQLEKELNLFVWSEYFPEETLRQFENEFHVKVNYSTYSSNEEMMAKLSVDSSMYDISVASDYMADAMRKKEILEPIDFNNVPNSKNIGKEYLNLSFDPEGKYTVPYAWGTVVIAVNTDKVKFPVESYKDLWRPEFKNALVVLDDPRTLIGVANKLQGKSMNETDPAVLEKTKQMLVELKPNIKAFDSDSPKTLLVSGEVSAGLVWGAEASLARQSNPAIKTVLPKEGMQLWQDNFVIPKGAKHKKAAEAFINFILRPDVDAAIAKVYPYATPNIEARKLLDPAILEDPANYPPKEEIEKGEYLADLGEATTLFDRIWSEIKVQ